MKKQKLGMGAEEFDYGLDKGDGIKGVSAPG
jgi:hypothetical protein